jgi:hypothetical protein
LASFGIAKAIKSGFHSRRESGPAKTGKRVYVTLGKFDSRDGQDRFSEASIAAMMRVAGDAP